MSAESKSDSSDRLRPSASDVSPSNMTVTATASPLHAQSIASPGGDGVNEHQGDQHRPNKANSVNRQTAALYQHYLNTFNSSLSKEDVKSQRTRGSIPNSISQQMQQNTFREFQNHHYATHSYANQRSSGDGVNNQQLHQSPRLLNHNMAQPFHQTPPTRIPSSHNLNHYASPNITSNVNLSRSAPRDETMISYRSNSQPQQQQQNPPLTHQRTYSTGALPSNIQQPHQKLRQSRDGPLKMSAHSIRRDQQDRDSEEATTIREELENDLEGCKNSELEAISSLERNLPIELSFLIRQQAHCLAKTNYLERQLRELKESVHHQQQVDINRVPSGSMTSRGHSNRPVNMGAPATLTHTKNGNFILSDDSGGEYSRATLSDDDELSSLLDQIVKTVRPDQRVMNDNMLVNSDSQMQHPPQQQQYPQQNRLTTTYNAIINKQQQPQPQQPYAIISPNQIHPQQAVPIFVMSSPFAVAHPSSINSNILPGVHFQPEPRYNQYYEDFYAVNNTPPSTIAAPTSSMMHRQAFNPNAHRSQHFDNSISAIEQLVSQKEKRQIIAQMKSADNWLKMRTSNSSSNLFNQQEGSLKNAGDKQTAMTTSDDTQGQGDAASIR